MPEPGGPIFERSVNPIPTREERLSPPILAPLVFFICTVISIFTSDIFHNPIHSFKSQKSGWGHPLDGFIDKIETCCFHSISNFYQSWIDIQTFGCVIVIIYVATASWIFLGGIHKWRQQQVRGQKLRKKLMVHSSTVLFST